MAWKPTPYLAVNTLVQDLLNSVQQVLAHNFVGMYLEGSLANGDFDQESDIDFIVVADEPVSGELFTALHAMHQRFAAREALWADQFEGSYVPQAALRHPDPNQALFPNLERGRGERLKWVSHDDSWGWIIHRYILRMRGITLAGPSPESLIEPILPDELRQAMRQVLHGWAMHFLDHPDKLSSRGYQSYVVLSICRILFTLQLGDVASKPAAVRWAQATFGEPWRALTDDAWIGRQHSQMDAHPDAIKRTLDFIRFAMERVG